MNRAQRRRQAHAPRRHTQQQPALDTAPIQIRYGHDDSHVLIIFSQLVGNMRMTLDEAVAMREQLLHVMNELQAHQANPKPMGRCTCGRTTPWGILPNEDCQSQVCPMKGLIEAPHGR